MISFSELKEKSKTTKKDETIAVLENEVQCLKDRLNETYFWAAAIIVGLIDALAFRGLEYAGISALLVFELVGFTCAAKRLGIEKVVELLDGLLSFIKEKFSKSSKQQ